MAVANLWVELFSCNLNYHIAGKFAGVIFKFSFGNESEELDGGDKKVAAIENLIFPEGALLNGQGQLTVFPFQDGDNVRIQTEGFKEIDAHGT
ncbi:hypothetical protein [Syntrophus aciditrophicus]|uniref:Hypothetical cytosolic protein n=1 Tax=Syntrophus aciditrophicus (strain SB) TaxID=56780 RepID=Q2LRS7_SYNAS|nr:hypothetical protein [Syntrophus aciditrophicus]ABC76787.1 hypothetical cytosolic protein [Syntrophus aciditrophicus SB]